MHSCDRYSVKRMSVQISRSRMMRCRYFFAHPQRSFPPCSIPAEYEAETVAQLQAELQQIVAAESRAAATGGAGALPAMGEGLAATEVVSESIQHAAAISYHQLADAYIREVRKIQCLARSKQAELQTGAAVDDQGPGA